ncbi:hypothetical protein A2Z61_00970 [Candidatus Campbellbacteria bacterium RIFCSPLOWO2_02_35_12]|uniref:Bacterial type II secretion system protein E domain-containing protein n=1 Tax=Candidatus Campbellbacteria bacterium RIFCSPLOWO2_02_35_12 TaxID=1797580 RepID=A0A1F5EI75_9BACT|nr:MAG: hypothetical protein A2Z61_00970 [Candidatus Campbellbacteria bacterium RIFCSPLOWO2_02_35_12]
MNLLSILEKKNIIDEKDIALIKKEAEISGNSFEKILIKTGIKQDIILKAKGEYYNIPIWELKNKSVPFEVFKYIPEESALHYKFVPLGVSDNILEVGILDPDNLDALDALNFISSNADTPFKIYLISENDFDEIYKMYKGFSGEVNRAISELDTELVKDKKIKALGEDKKVSNTDIIKEDAPVTKIVANIIHYAVEERASDIHIEHMSNSIRVRFRVDGTLSTSLMLPLKTHQAVVARLKVLSSMKLDEKRRPQDGRFSAKINNRKVDFRVSTFPSYYGEKVVIRILDTDKGVRKIDEFGLSERNLRLIKNAIKQPYGLILISGPTGSGKSTTLYSMLNETDHESKNVLSLEDPIEYNIDGISQSQVRPEIGYTFANGLRTTLRQDPDIIMVGEIRDKETAGLAVQAALTGHLVLSTIHTNNAIGVIPRLLEMEVDPFLIAPTLIIAVAQRLVRTLCPATGKPIEIEESMRKMIESQFSDLPEKYRKTLPIGKNFFDPEPNEGCPTGMRGRMAVFEIIEMNKEIEEIILKNPSDLEIQKIARKNGMLTMKEDAILKAFDKKIPFSEINTLGGEFLFEENNLEKF